VLKEAASLVGPFGPAAPYVLGALFLFWAALRLLPYFGHARRMKRRSEIADTFRKVSELRGMERLTEEERERAVQMVRATLKDPAGLSASDSNRGQLAWPGALGKAFSEASWPRRIVVAVAILVFSLAMVAVAAVPLVVVYSFVTEKITAASVVYLGVFAFYAIFFAMIILSVAQEFYRWCLSSLRAG
jgi:VIT1/CCC1 family predicted Fe2+/Mn2+ transporter